jgi:hypothetical protein
MLGGITTAYGWDHEPVMVDPFEFDPDFQWFEPVTNMDLADLKPSKRAHTGWFATYDKLKLYGSRPETNNPQDIDSKLDSGSGDRYEVGFMLPDEDTGWMFNWTDMRVNDSQLVGPVLVQQFLIFNRAYPVAGIPQFSGSNSINVFDYDSYELNKTWRMEPYHYGGILEPMMGIRWMRIGDTKRIETYEPPLITDPEEVLGRVESRFARTDNDLFGGQLGFRYMKFRDRFTFSTDFRVFAGGSWQCSESQKTERDLLLLESAIPDAGTVVQVDPLITRRDPFIRSRNEEGFVGFDVRSELAYQLTRHFSIRAGIQVIDVATGVWRGGDGSIPELGAGNQNQDLLMVGGTFGINLNR